MTKNKVWDRVVTDLEKYNEQQRQNNTLWGKIKRFFVEGNCNGECHQGRKPCNCERRYGK